MEQNKPAVVSNKQLTPHKESQSHLIGAWIRNKDEEQIYLSQFGKKLKEFKNNEDKVDLIKSITTWRLHLGIREKMSDEELIINITFLKDSYPTITLEDIRLAIRYSLNGTLNVNPEAFGSFSPLYISKIINAYLEHKKDEIQRINAHKRYLEVINQKEPELSYTEKIESKKNHIKWFYKTLMASDSYVADFQNYLWDLLNRKQFLHPDKIDWEDAEEKAEILTNRNVYSTFAKVMANMKPDKKEEEKKRLKELYGRYYIMKQFFEKVTDIDMCIGQLSNEDILPSSSKKEK
jgi:hypothetical protein